MRKAAILAGIIALAGAALIAYEPARGAPADASSQEEHQTRREVRSGGSVVLEPPGARSPQVPRQVAVQTARAYAFYVNEGSPVSSRFALYRNNDWRPVQGDGADRAEGPLTFEDTSAWIVTFHDACIPYMGSIMHEPPEGCASTELNVVINADTGEYIQAFSDR